MTKTQYRKLLKDYGLTQHQAAELFGASHRSGRRWATVEGAVPHAIALLFTIMREFDLQPDDLMKLKARIR